MLQQFSQAAMLTGNPNNGFWEYLLVANPDDAINGMVKAEKELFHQHFHQKIAIKTKPHITVANFLAVESMEETIIKWLQRICGQQYSFSVMLNNYGGFPPHTIYLRVQNPQPFLNLAKQLKVIDNFICDNGCPPARLTKNPHMTIARRLPEEIYSKALIDYAQRDFHATFVARELVLLKRRHQLDACQHLGVFRFLPDVVNTDTTQQSALAF